MGLISSTTGPLRETARVITSKPAQRAAVNAVLFLSTALTLLGLASIATALFFQSYVPHRVLSMPVHLQYGLGPNPFGIVSLTTPQLKNLQDYDISITLMMPRSLPNLERGNFMVSLDLLDLTVEPGSKWESSGMDGLFNSKGAILYSTRRTALIPYVDPAIRMARHTLFLLYYLIAPTTANTVELTVPLAERVSFSKGAVIPSAAYVEIEGGQDIQTYNATLNFLAKLRGLRWLMFHYRLPTYVVFTMLFWCSELFFAIGAWTIWGMLLSSPVPRDIDRENGGRYVKYKGQQQKEEGFDSSHTFPTYAGAQSLKYEPDIKEEEDISPALSEIPIAGAEADDEADDVDMGHELVQDSGIGTTSFSEREGGSGSVRRRTGQGLAAKREASPNNM